MSDTRISQLPTANVVSKNDLLYLVQNEESKNVALGTIFDSLIDPTLVGNISLGGSIVDTITGPGVINIQTTRTDLFGGPAADANAIANGTVLPSTIYLYTANTSASGRGLQFANDTPITTTLYVTHKNNKINLSTIPSTVTYGPDDWVGQDGSKPFPYGLKFIKGGTYIFDVSDPTNASNIIGLSISIDGTNTLGQDYTPHVTRNGTPGTAGANIVFAPPLIPVDLGGKNYLDIPRGVDGQLKVINLVRTSGGSFVITSNIKNNLAIELRKVGDSAFLMYSGNAWLLVGANPGLATTFSGTSDDVPEGQKLYFTVERARASFSAGDATIIYDQANGTLRANLGFVGAAETANFANSSAYATDAGNAATANLAQLAVFANTANTAYVAYSLSANGLSNVHLSVLSNLAVAPTVTVNDLTVNGNLTVEGNVVTLNTATLTVEDKNIVVANGAITASQADGAGITISGANANIIYYTTGDKFVINKSTDFIGNVYATGFANVLGNISVEGNATVLGTGNIAGNLAVGGNLTVAGDVTLNGLLTANAATAVSLGTPSIGNLTSNAAVFTTATSVTNGIAKLNEILGKLVPPSPPNFPGAYSSITVSGMSSYRMADFTQTDNTPGVTLSVAGGTTVTTVKRVASYTTTTVANVGPGDSGTVSAWLNGANVGSRALTTSLDGAGTYGNLVISGNYDYNRACSTVASGFWSVVSAYATGTAPNGWNRIYLSHTAASNTSAYSWYYDSSSPGTPAFSNTSILPTTNVYANSSTVPHYTSSSSFTLSANVNRLSGDMYPVSDTFLTGTAGGAFSAPSSKTYAQAGITTPLARNLYVASGNAAITTSASIISGFGSSSGSPSISVVNSYNTGTQSFSPGATILYKTGTSSAMEETAITLTGTIGSGSGAPLRIENPGSTDTPAYSAGATAFNSSTSTLQTYDATIVAAVLKHDQTNYSTGYLPVGPDLSSGRSGAQYFTFKFTRTSVSKFDIKWTGTIAGLWVALPGSVIDTSSTLNGWLDLSQSYAGAGVPGAGTGGNGSDGGSLGGVAPLNSAQINKQITATFGTVSSSSTATNEIYVRIKLTSGQTVTALSLLAASN